MDGFFIAVLLGIIEGVTEFLPVSSTGHLILANNFLGFAGGFANTFDIVIQTGAILSVVVYFRGKIFPFGKGKTRKEKEGIYCMWKKTVVGVIPAMLLGFAFGKQLEEMLFNPLVVSIALVVGGIALIVVEKKKRVAHIDTLSFPTYKTAFFIGLIQCIAFIPGVSRSAATIIGAMLLGASRLAATEYSFYLAIPTLAGASAYSLIKSNAALSGEQTMLLLTGFIVSFFVAYAVIAFFMNYVSRNDFKVFGYYRILLGAIIIAFYLK